MVDTVNDMTYIILKATELLSIRDPKERKILTLALICIHCSYIILFFIGLTVG